MQNALWLIIAFLFINQKGSHAQTFFRKDDQKKLFQSKFYGVQFKYPANWERNPKYKERYDAEDGFFELAEIETFGKNIDQVVKQEIGLPLQPYGTEPEITKLTIEGQPARLIIPSADQLACLEKESALILQNREPVIINGEPYEYLMIWVDKEHIQEVIRTLKFMN